MKTKQEIEQLAAREHWNSNIESRSFIKGYTQCQEDMVKELYEFGKLVLDTFHSEGRTHSGKDRFAGIQFDEWCNSLNKHA